ncbi:MAG TPA: hypothetical protein VFQ72_04005 [Candidatus Paceibacterota bacterium]|nr:hypothetical protein [Candidatus Paceibacterota bacterium]
MQALNIPSGVQTRGVPVSLAKIHTVLVKFSFTNPKHIPQGLPEGKRVTWELRTLKDQVNAAAVHSIDPELAKKGRIHENYVDTGVRAVDNLQLVQLGIIRRGLTNSGFQLRAVHVQFVPAKPDRRDPKRMTFPKHVVELVFQNGDFFEEATATEDEKAARATLESPQVVGALRALANTTWQWCHVWDNSKTAGTATVNVGGRLPEGKPRNCIAVRNRSIAPVAIQATMSESEE